MQVHGVNRYLGRLVSTQFYDLCRVCKINLRLYIAIAVFIAESFLPHVSPLPHNRLRQQRSEVRLKNLPRRAKSEPPPWHARAALEPRRAARTAASRGQGIRGSTGQAGPGPSWPGFVRLSGPAAPSLPKTPRRRRPHTRGPGNGFGHPRPRPPTAPGRDGPGPSKPRVCIPAAAPPPSPPGFPPALMRSI